eukprot:COSAG01_NODE_38589_length_487_cov_7.067010_1_plen_80_part_10
MIVRVRARWAIGLDSAAEVTWAERQAVREREKEQLRWAASSLGAQVDGRLQDAASPHAPSRPWGVGAGESVGVAPQAPRS